MRVRAPLYIRGEDSHARRRAGVGNVGPGVPMSCRVSSLDLLFIRIVMQSGHHRPRAGSCITNRARTMDSVNLQRF